MAKKRSRKTIKKNASVIDKNIDIQKKIQINPNDLIYTNNFCLKIEINL